MEYHKNTEKISKSGLDLIHKSPLHYWERYLNPAAQERKTPALILGSAVHCAVLEPGEFGKRYAIAPEVDRRTKEGKEIMANFEASIEGLEVISKADSVICERIMEAINKHDEASLLMSKITEVEKVIEVEDMKCRPDAIIEPLNLIIDLKTTDDASQRTFGRSALKYRYDVQAAFYIDLYEKFKIVKMVVNLRTLNNQSNSGGGTSNFFTNGQVHSVIDYTDLNAYAATQAGIDEMMQDDTYKVTPSTRNHRRSVIPQYLNNVDTSNNQKSVSGWQNTKNAIGAVNSSVYLGLKVIIEPGYSNVSAPQTSYILVPHVTTFIQFKDPR